MLTKKDLKEATIKTFRIAKIATKFIVDKINDTQQKIESEKQALNSCSTEELKEIFIKPGSANKKIAAGLLLKERGVDIKNLQNN